LKVGGLLRRGGGNMYMCPVCGKKFGVNMIYARREAENHIIHEHYGSGAKPIEKKLARTIAYH